MVSNNKGVIQLDTCLQSKVRKQKIHFILIFINATTVITQATILCKIKISRN